MKESNRVSKSPALIVDHQSAAVRRCVSPLILFFSFASFIFFFFFSFFLFYSFRIMSRMDPNNKPRLPRQNFEYNLKHPIMKKINELRFTNEPFAELAIEQVFDNALIAAGLLDDPRGMLERLNDVLETALDHHASGLLLFPSFLSFVLSFSTFFLSNIITTKEERHKRRTLSVPSLLTSSLMIKRVEERKKNRQKSIIKKNIKWLLCVIIMSTKDNGKRNKMKFHIF